MSAFIGDDLCPERLPLKLDENSSVFRYFIAERDEIMRHKWLESEKAGYDIGIERALLDWALKHRADWRRTFRGQG